MNSIKKISKDVTADMEEACETEEEPADDPAQGKPRYYVDAPIRINDGSIWVSAHVVVDRNTKDSVGGNLCVAMCLSLEMAHFITNSLNFITGNQDG